MTDLLKIPTWAEEQYIYAVVETPRGSTCKLDFDPALRAFTLAKPLMAGLTYPYDWGFIPSTKAEDGDPLDVLVIHDAKTYPGVVLRCRPVGILEVEQKSKGKAKERNDRVFAVPDRSPLETDLQTSAASRRGLARNWKSFSGLRTRSKTKSSSFSGGMALPAP
jgi:inorganic pyrophosphatase